MILTPLQELAQSLVNCEHCKLAKLGRSQVVFGVGNPQASIMFVGEAPGFNEDQKGEPFVGAAGKLLNDLLASAGLSRDQIYIANVIKCRPPNNRDPEQDEVETCKPFLLQQIKLIQPKLVCTLGNWATLGLHGGYTYVRNYSEVSYADWRVSLAKTWGIWTASLAYAGTSADDRYYRAANGQGQWRSLGRSGWVLGLSAGF